MQPGGFFLEEEREAVARGGNIKLGIYGTEPIPPVSLQIVHEGMTMSEDAADGGDRSG